MGRGRGKLRKLASGNNDDPGSGEEEKIPLQKRRGRPQKPLKDDIDEEEAEKIEDDDVESAKPAPSIKEAQSPTAADNGKKSTAADNGKKRKQNTQEKERTDSFKEGNSSGTRSSTDDSTRPNGFRHNGSRRKNKPRRAAEAGVECM